MLYRVVTHTIREEMVDQPPPAFQELAPAPASTAAVWCPTGPTGPAPSPMHSSRGAPGTNAIYTTSIYNTESAVAWRMLARTTWARYLWRMRNYVISQLDGGEDTNFVEAQLFQDIDEIADSLKPFYGLVASKQVAQLMRAFVLTEIDIVKAVKNRQSIEPLKARHTQQVEEFAAFLNSANSRHWPRDAVLKIFGQLMNCWQQEAVARQAKDWARDVEAVDRGHRIVLAGQDDGTPAFSEIFAKGVIAQFPDRFVD